MFYKKRLYIFFFGYPTIHLQSRKLNNFITSASTPRLVLGSTILCSAAETRGRQLRLRVYNLYYDRVNAVAYLLGVISAWFCCTEELCWVCDFCLDACLCRDSAKKRARIAFRRPSRRSWPETFSTPETCWARSTPRQRFMLSNWKWIKGNLINDETMDLRYIIDKNN